MKKSNVLSLVLLLLLAGLSACQSHEEESVLVATPIEVSLDESRCIREQNNFGFNLLSKLSNDENCVISPVSLSMGLSMVANGADGETRAEILNALGMDDLEQLNSINAKLLNALPKVDPNKVEIAFGNALFADPSMGVYDSFKSTLLDSFQADVVDTDLPSDKIREAVNGFVSKKTRGYITEAMPDISGDVSMALVNALYFKGAWARAFDKDKATTDKFYNLDGSISEVEMMYLDAMWWNPVMNIEILDDGARVGIGFTLEYGNGSYSMTILEPESSVNGTIEGFLEKLVAGTYFTSSLTSLDYIKLPKFSIDTQKDFSQILNAIGIKKAFNPEESDFSNLSPLSGVSVDKVFHTTKFEVDEDGATGVASSEYIPHYSGYHPDGRYWIFDHPFIFYITEKSSGAVVFAGKVTKL